MQIVLKFPYTRATSQEAPQANTVGCSGASVLVLYGDMFFPRSRWNAVYFVSLESDDDNRLSFYGSIARRY